MVGLRPFTVMTKILSVNLLNSMKTFRKNSIVCETYLKPCQSKIRIIFFVLSDKLILPKKEQLRSGVTLIIVTQ